MSRLSHWMIGYGVLLIATETIGLMSSFPIGLHHWIPLSGMSHGLLMIAAGLACVQGRRSLRLSGAYVGTLLPLGIGIILLWDAVRFWDSTSMMASALLGMSAILSFGFVAQFYRLRPQDGIETRGYAVALSRLTRRPPVIVDTPIQSKAG